MMKNKLAILLCVSLIIGLCACGNSNVGGLGQLVIGKDDDVTSPTGTNTVPDLPGNGTITPTPKGGNFPAFPGNETTPTPVTTPVTPTPVNAPGTLTTTLYTDNNISMRVPSGWTVNCQSYNSGGGIYRLFCCVYNPKDPTNQIFFCTALEPFFTSEASKQQFVNILPEYSFAPVIDELNAAAVLKVWSSVYSGIRMTDATNPKISDLLWDFSVSSVISQEDGGIVNGGYYTSVLASVVNKNGGDYIASYTNLLVQNLQTGIEFYQSYANFMCLAKKELADTYIPVLNECVASLDISGFQQNHRTGITAGDDSNDETVYMYLPRLNFDYETLKDLPSSSS